jgi:hypothetical protein
MTERVINIAFRIVFHSIQSDSSFTARAKTHTSNRFKIFKNSGMTVTL